MQLSVDGLRCFCAIVETGSFSDAAERVFRSQPAVSQQLKSLENETGHRLFDRRAGQPTEAGRELYVRARQILADLESAQRRLRELKQEGPSELRIGASDTTAQYILPPIVRRFAQDHPRTRLVLIHRSTDAIADLTERGEIDLGLVTLPVGRATLEERVLRRQQIVLVVPHGHPFARKRRLTLKALEKESMLLLDENTRTGKILRACLREAGFEPQVGLDSGSFEVIKRHVAAGVGVALLPDAVISEHDTGLATVNVPGLPEIVIGAIWRKRAGQTKAAQEFLDLLIEK